MIDHQVLGAIAAAHKLWFKATAAAVGRDHRFEQWREAYSLDPESREAYGAWESYNRWRVWAYDACRAYNAVVGVRCQACGDPLDCRPGDSAYWVCSECDWEQCPDYDAEDNPNHATVEQWRKSTQGDELVNREKLSELNHKAQEAMRALFQRLYVDGQAPADVVELVYHVHRTAHVYGCAEVAQGAVDKAGFEVHGMEKAEREIEALGKAGS